MKVTRPSARSVVAGVGLILVGALLVVPVGAHVNKRFGHLWKKHIKPKLSTQGTINKAKNPLDWTKLKNVPPGFADGTDDVTGGAGGGDITSVAAGTGLTGGGDSGDVSLGTDFSAIQARISNDCIPPAGIPNPSKPDFGSSIESIKADGTVICEDDDVGPKGVVVVVQSSPTDSSTYKQAVAKCPPPKIAISGGAYIGGTIYRELAINNSNRGNDAEWVAGAHEVVPLDKDWYMWAEAVCVFP